MKDATTKKQNNENLPLTKKEAMDILLQHVAEGKKDIACGRVLTVDQTFATIRRKP